MTSERARTSARSAVLAAVLGSFCCTAEPPAAPESLGTVDFPVSCDPEAQAAFNRAVALLHHMTYPEARRAFEEIADRSPDCAMAHWGVAMTLFQPLWPTRPSDADLRLGWEEVQRANELVPPTSRERLFVAMAEAFFRPDAGDYWSRITGWEAAARAAHEALPGDVEAAAFYALAHLATAPATGGTEHHDAAAAVLLGILGEQPSHPGAVHYTVHANDAPGRERESLEVVRRYLEIAPRNPHALHMPTHIFVRLGDWSDVIEWNVSAAEAALAHPAGERGQWVWDEFPHATEYLVYAHLQLGDDDAAHRAMTRLQETSELQPSFKTAFHLSSIPARYALERRDWSQASALPARPGAGLPWDRFPWPEAVTWFARGLGTIHGDDRPGAREAEERLAALREAARRAGEDLFARHIEILRLELAAWMAESEGRADEALELMWAAVAIEAETPKHAVTPAPTLPAVEQLGDLLMELDRPAEALESYLASLAATPGRFNGLLGAARAAEAAGDTAVAAAYYRQLRERAVPGSPRPEVAEADSFLARYDRPDP
jgi:tetratricopeptide (TPR) repeat protein